MSATRQLPSPLLPPVRVAFAPAAGGVACGLASALLFGAAGPLLKPWLAGVHPLVAAALLQLGAGAMTAGAGAARSRLTPGTETPLRRADALPMATIVAFGGVLAPLLFVLGLARSSASSCAVLVNLSGALAALLAWAAFREPVGRRVALGLAAVLGGAVVVGWSGGGAGAGGGALLVLGACVLWAIDTNASRLVSGRDPFEVAAWKGAVAGSVLFAASLAAGAPLPALRTVVVVLAVGALGNGASLALFVLALRELGAARATGASSTSPVAGLAVAWLVLGERPGPRLVAGAALMAWGVWLQVTERHAHVHVHDEIEHEHRHVHDEHHRHAHAPDDPPGEPHAHAHRHAPLVHAHPHRPDLHHTHAH